MCFPAGVCIGVHEESVHVFVQRFWQSEMLCGSGAEGLAGLRMAWVIWVVFSKHGCPKDHQGYMAIIRGLWAFYSGFDRHKFENFPYVCS